MKSRLVVLHTSKKSNFDIKEDCCARCSKRSNKGGHAWFKNSYNRRYRRWVKRQLASLPDTPTPYLERDRR